MLYFSKESIRIDHAFLSAVNMGEDGPFIEAASAQQVAEPKDALQEHVGWITRHAPESRTAIEHGDPCPLSALR